MFLPLIQHATSSICYLWNEQKKIPNKGTGVEYHTDKDQNAVITGTCLVMLTPDAEHTRCTFLGVNATQSEHGIVSDYVYFEAYTVMSLPTLAAAIRIYEIAELNQVKITMSCSNADIISTYCDN
ncbi:unnamed protein product [Adineta steineri]|uniref:Uncharacterized protein n=1 Tax=Adineta steineri TaxID=433720 RepID=A0A813SFH2_9BILA|nr:unnamed protein product [Adineta steineri]CAF3851137.1 unnamed protein product [Adineta steineri]